MSNSRLIAVKWLASVYEGRSVNEITAQRQPEMTPQQTALAKQLLFGSLRFFHQLKTLADNLLNSPLKAKDNDILMAIIVGLYQLKYLSTPDHAAISESVELTRELKKSWASGMVNGVLRRYQREAEELTESLGKSLQYQYSHPGWMIKKIRADWPEHSEQILAANNERAPMVLRVNRRQISRADYIDLLAQQAIGAQPHPVASDAMVLDSPLDVSLLPGFTEGQVTVQDAAPQLAVDLLQLQPGQKVLDACAAPGGKTGHILQRAENLALTAVELSARRTDRMREALARQHLNCEVITADILDTNSWWNGESFERILLDVPCSATGVIRRNPDIKIHRKVTDIPPLVSLQQQILESCWQLLKPGGILVYATCSIFKAENEQQIQAFLTRHQAALVELPVEQAALLGEVASVGYQILPGEQMMDGFYLCGLQKPA